MCPLQIFMAMKKFFKFVLHPTENLQNRGWSVWAIFTFVYILYSVCSNIIIYYLFSEFNSNVPLKTGEIDDIHISILLLLPPILEEAGFRLCLIRHRPYIFISLCVIMFLLLSKFVFGVVYSLESLIARIAIALTLGTLLFFMTKRALSTIKFPTYFYTLVLLFSLLHCFNYKLSDVSSLGKYIYILSYGLIKIPSSIILGYIRLSNGFVPVVCSHILHNAPTVILRHLV